MCACGAWQTFANVRFMSAFRGEADYIWSRAALLRAGNPNRHSF